MNYGAPLGVAQAAADAGMTPRGTRLVLDSLVSQGLVRALGQPRSQVFAVVSQHPMATALAALFEYERGRWDALQDGMRRGLALQPDIRSAWLYGSAARGEDEPRSDVDLALVVHDDTLDAAHRARDAVQSLGDGLNVHVSAVVLTPLELARLPPGDAWWADVLRDAKVLKGLSPGKEAARCARLVQPA